MSLFDRRYESMPRAELEQLQLERCQALLARLRRYVRRYREPLADIRVESLNDLAALPFTNPEDMADSFPYGLFAVPMREVIRLNSTLGPGGTPLAIGHTRNDLAQWGRLVARQLTAGGATANDVIQIGLGASTYRGASGYVLGAELIEASVIADEASHIDSQLAMLQNYRPTILITTPTNALDLMELMDRRAMEPPSFLRTLLLSRPISNDMREQLRAGLLVTVHCNFGIEDILDPGFALECEAGRFHVNEDQFLVEAVDGELIVTTLGREAMPLLRYRTRISCALSHEKCSCGRTSATIHPAQRLDRRLRVGETPLYESQIAELLERTPVAGRPFQCEISDRRILILIEMTTDLFSDMVWPIAELQGQIQSDFLERLGVEAEVRFVEPNRLPKQ